MIWAKGFWEFSVMGHTFRSVCVYKLCLEGWWKWGELTGSAVHTHDTHDLHVAALWVKGLCWQIATFSKFMVLQNAHFDSLSGIKWIDALNALLSCMPPDTHTESCWSAQEGGDILATLNVQTPFGGTNESVWLLSCSHCVWLFLLCFIIYYMSRCWVRTLQILLAPLICVATPCSANTLPLLLKMSKRRLRGVE